MDRFADEGNGDAAGYNQITKALEETGILCNFEDSGMTYELLGELLAAGIIGFNEFQDLSYLLQSVEKGIPTDRREAVKASFTATGIARPRTEFDVSGSCPWISSS